MRERNTKKQQELLLFIGEFLNEHNYAPSYREITVALGYKSVSTVAVHVNGLITHGYLTKSDKSARSIRVVDAASSVDNNHLAWLRTEIAKREAAGSTDDVDALQKALDVLTS